MGSRISHNNFSCDCVQCYNLASKNSGKYKEFLDNYNFYANSTLYDYQDCVCFCSNSFYKSVENKNLKILKLFKGLDKELSPECKENEK